jgi:hypothetical protein
MLAELGPLETARKLLNAPAVSDGFSNLWDRGRLDLTVEALVLRPEFAPLFTEASWLGPANDWSSSGTASPTPSEPSGAGGRTPPGPERSARRPGPTGIPGARPGQS